MNTIQHKPIFCVVDPNLRDFVGHHFEYDESVAAMAAQRGLDTLVLGHADVNPNISARIAVRPTFALDIWAAHPDLKGAAIEDDIMLCNRSFHRDLLAGFEGARMTGDAVIFGHMITAKQLLGWAWFAKKFARRDGPTIILLLRYQRSFYEWKACEQAFRILERAARRGSVRLASDSARLASQIGRLTSLPIEEFPIPHTANITIASEEFGSADQAALHEPNILRLVSLGNARDEKGIIEIFEAIRVLHAEGRADGLEFVLQVNDPQKEIKEAIDAFAELRLPRVKLLREALDSDAYYRLLRSAEVVLVPYWRSIYEARTSGVFLEALAAAKPVICTQDTWMSDQLRIAGAGELCRDRDSRDLIRAIEEVRRNYVELAARAKNTQGQWIARHNASRLIEQAVNDATQRIASTPPQRVAVLYPWGDILSGGSGAALRTNLLLEFLQDRVAEIRVLQPGAMTGQLSENIRVEAYDLETESLQRLHRKFDKLSRFLLRVDKDQTFHLWWHLAPLLDRNFRNYIVEIVRWADVILLEYTYWGRLVEKACRLTGRRFVLSNHDVVSDQVTQSRLLKGATRYLEFRAMARADAAVAVAVTDQAEFAEAGIATAMIANPIDVTLSGKNFPGDTLYLLESIYDLSLRNQKIVLFVGSKHKPNELAAEVIRTIAKQIAHDRPDDSIRFVIVGGCAEPIREDNFWALGRVDNFVLDSLYLHASLVLIPLPFGTGASLKTIEAMARGKAVLGTAIAFRGLAVKSGFDCIVESNVEKYSELIVELVSNEKKLAQIANQGRAFAQNYDYRKVFASYLPLLGLPNEPGHHLIDDATKAKKRLLATVRVVAARAVTKERWQDARTLLGFLLAAAPDDGEANFLMAEAYARQDPPDPTARLYYDKAISGGYDKFEIWLARRRLSLAIGDTVTAEQEEAAFIRLKVDAASSDPELVQFRKAVWKLFHTGNNELVLRLYEALRSRYPDRQQEDLEYLAGQSLHNLHRDPDKALEHYNRALALGFDEAWVRYHRGRLLRELGRNAEAEADLARAATLKPDDPEFEKQLHGAQREPIWQDFFKGDYEAVLNQVQPALARNPNDADLHYLAGQSLHSLHRDLETAVQHYNRALALGFDEAWVRYHRGRLLRELGRNAEGETDLARAATLKPDDPEFQKKTHAARLELLSDGAIAAAVFLPDK